MEGLHLIPVRASTMAHSVDTLFVCMVILSAFFTVLIATAILVFVIKYRRRSDNEVGANIGSHAWIEWLWSIGPFILMLVIFFWSSGIFVEMSRAPANALEIHVVGKQWMWKIQHPSGRKEIDELHVPLGVSVQLTMTSQDVIHSFFLPAFRIKQDVLPGRYSHEWFTPDRLGSYHIFCSQYCGTGHADMVGTVTVMTPGDYDRWSANVPLEDRPESAGGKLFTQYGCINCHAAQAPTLAGIYNRPQLLSTGESVIADDNYLRESILNSRAKIVAGYPPIMPSYQGQLSEEQLNDLLAYIKGLQPAKRGAAP